jgi:two-component system OmpR family response regulator
MPTSARPTVLIVEDDPPVRLVLGLLAERSGYAALSAAGGAEGVEVFARHRGAVAAVLLDVEMPGWDGPRTLAELRRLDPAVRCVFVTGRGTRYPDDELAGLGAAVVSKPLTLAAMGDALRAVCRPV